MKNLLMLLLVTFVSFVCHADSENKTTYMLGENGKYDMDSEDVPLFVFSMKTKILMILTITN